MQRALPLLLVVLCACPQPEPTPSSSSSSSGGGGGSSASVVTDAGARGNGIELGQLCRELREGYRRAFLRTLNRCGAAYDDVDLERLDTLPFDSAERATLQQAQGQLASASCDQFGSLRVYLDHVLQSVDRDRVRYSAEAALKCREGSTRPTLSSRDRPPIQSGAFNLEGIEMPAVCHEVFEGLVQEDEGCDLTHECRDPLYCRPTSDDTALGTCRPPVAMGAACDSRDTCDNGGICENAQCRGPRVRNESCLDEQGFELPCGPSLVCVDGHCAAYGESNELCSFGMPPCRPGLVCTGSAAQPGVLRCKQPVDVGGTCASSLECVDCARCNDDGKCATYKAQGESCEKADDACAPGLRCADDNTCKPLPRTGEICEAAFLSSSSQRGNCMYVDEFCKRESAQSETGICTPFPALGEDCGNGPDVYPTCASTLAALYCSDATRGTCVPPARHGERCSTYGDTFPACENGYCRLSADGGDDGICDERPNIGEPCGLTPDLSAYCQTGFCKRLGDAPAGVCAAMPDIAETCGTESHLTTQCSYGACVLMPGATQGTCAYQRNPGAPCSVDEECTTFVCDDQVHRCITPSQSCQGCSRFEPILFILSLGMVVRRKRSNVPRWRGMRS